MSSGERFEESLLAELRELETFRTRYHREQPAAQLDREDPDVRRLLEALAFSAVRTRQAALRNQSAAWRRLLGSYFDFLLQPLPAMGIAQAVVTARMSEAAVLPRGTELRLTTQDGEAGCFTTLSELRVVPMTLERCETVLRPQGFRLVLLFGSRFPRTDAVGTLRLYVHYLDDYLAALQAHHHLQQHLQRAFVAYDYQGSAEAGVGVEAAVTFGPHFEPPYTDDVQNPLARVRSFFHFPQQELLLNIKVPPPRQPWRQLAICLDMSPDWPRSPPIYREALVPFAVPVQNVRRAPSQPILCDGTRDAYPIRYIHPDRSFSLQSCHGVYKLGEAGMAPLPATAISKAAAAYEVVELGESEAGASALILRPPLTLPSSGDKPLRLAVDASWYQPEFADHATGRIQVTLPERSILGLEWQLSGPLRRHLDTPLRHDSERLLHLLSLKMRPVLDREELLVLLDMLGSVQTGPYRAVPDRLRDLAVEVAPDGMLRGAGVRHIYHAQILPGPGEEEPLVRAFLRQLRVLLDAWDYEARVEIAPHVGVNALPRPLPPPEEFLR